MIVNNKSINKNYESSNNISKLITEPSSVKRKKIYSQNLTPNKSENKCYKIKNNFDDKKKKKQKN